MRDSASPPTTYDLGPGIRLDERVNAEQWTKTPGELDRRQILLLAGLCLSAPATGAMARAKAAPTQEIVVVTGRPLWPEFSAIEVRTGGRLGLWADSGPRIPPVAWRADERFLMCSTFKALAVAAVLAGTDRGAAHLDQRIAYGKSDLLEYAPVTTAHLAQGGMALGDLCAAAIELSDNTAANLILNSLGGPAAVTAYIRGLGDTVTRLDRTEPDLNRPAPGALDTTTPASMAGLWRRIVVGDALTPASRAQLNLWLAGCQTGADRLPSILPRRWKIGHKTGTGATTIGDVAVLRPPVGEPILIAAYLDGATCSDRQKDAAIAEAGRVALRGVRSVLKVAPYLHTATGHTQ